MVRSNLKHVEDREVSAEEIVRILHHNGYHRVANEVERRIEEECDALD